eukprot:CAMPEP_0177550002 /NCGR_PEP_ID=MMETSP0369-20130122/65332_1 /TAXON_ID=447022 ORGANISM="Scrippsiella hangoei-like, Strain SHHI-4" /NCGR_SAMPLE_ID=MMETSP0369 /ASSEMBLY_ACC=CAM_ASM_000364 /LENGTH=56 /DNA_ID=CAMNT_0019035159 /DNA_START=26 /DNA_END=192 /DNA_ORIENTATION=-
MFEKASLRDNFCPPPHTTASCDGFSSATGGLSLQMDLMSLPPLTSSKLGLWAIGVG